MFDVMFESEEDKIKMVNMFLNTLNKKKKRYVFINSNVHNYNIYVFINYVIERLFRVMLQHGNVNFIKYFYESGIYDDYQFMIMYNVFTNYPISNSNCSTIEYVNNIDDSDIDMSHEYIPIIFRTDMIFNVSYKMEDVVNKINNMFDNYYNNINNDIVVHLLWLLQQKVNKDMSKYIIECYLDIYKKELCNKFY